MVFSQNLYFFLEYKVSLHFKKMSYAWYNYSFKYWCRSNRSWNYECYFGTDAEKSYNQILK
jgi:hypothetical protein